MTEGVLLNNGAPRESEDFKNRLEEHRAKLNLALSRSSAALTGVNSFDKEGQEAILRYATATEYETRTQTDGVWVIAMVAAGVPVDTILRVWDIKDEQERELPK